MDYSTLLALHLVAIVIWVGFLLINGAILGGKPDQRTVASIRRWNLRIAMPAMLLVWGLGITLAVQGGWFSAPWLHAKLLLVLILSALQGMQSGALRRMAADPTRKVSALLRASPYLTILLVVIVVFLVTAKPF